MCLLAIGVLTAAGALPLAAAEKPAAWWKFDAGAAGEAFNPWSPEGKRGGALALTGVGGVAVGEIGAFDALTVALWVRTDTLAHAFTALVDCDGWGPTQMHFQFADDGWVEFSVNGNKPVDTFSEAAPGAKAGTWNHVAVIYDSKAKAVRFYVNGKPDKAVAYRSSGPVRLGPLHLGAWDREPRFLCGRLDDVRIWGRALDDAAIAKVLAGDELKDGLEAWWRMDEKEGTKVADSSGKGRDGTLTAAGGGTTADSVGGAADEVRGKFKCVPGVAGKAMRFDGATTVVRKAAGAPKLNPDGFSIEAWVALASYPRGTGVIVQQQQARRGYLLGLDKEGHFNLQFALAREWKECFSLGPVPLGKWAHLAATYSPDSGINLYLNGRNAGNLVLLGPLWFAEDADLVIGQGLDGLLDDLVIHNAQLSPQEVLKHYEAGKSAPEPALAP
jgi:hypothetical protein